MENEKKGLEIAKDHLKSSFLSPKKYRIFKI